MRNVASLSIRVAAAAALMAGCASSDVDSTAAEQGADPTLQTSLAEMITIPAGDFIFGCNPAVDSNCLEDEMPHQRVFVDEFQIDQYEVTREAYYACVAAGDCSQPFDTFNPDIDLGGLAPDWQTRTNEPWPVIGVTWEPANTFCKVQGKRLPTEQEWEKAAKGGCELYNDCESDTPINPWGNTEATCTEVVLMTEDQELGCGEGGAQPVTVRPDGVSPYGVYNMIGNVSEWVDSEYQPHAEGQRDKLKQNAIGMKINKGACYGSFTTDMRIAARYTMADAQNYEDVPYSFETDSAMGFRCAK
ncbi:MAG: SUMF1/EgtB/PvdO family nonheme iron enzyme [Myxococcota bacterium]|nr:SUMF1/EgtB/PvdO family nonheme iron enzyme [Myxococcota bacterium]